MEKLEVGQVWSNGKTRREIFQIRDDGSIDCIGASLLKNKTESEFRSWIARTGAKLEGRDGEL